MSKNTSISLGDHFDRYIRKKVSEGRYRNSSEVIRAGLRLLEEEDIRIQYLKSELQAGIDSGIATDFDPASHLESLKKRKQDNG